MKVYNVYELKIYVNIHLLTNVNFFFGFLYPFWAMKIIKIKDKRENVV